MVKKGLGDSYENTVIMEQLRGIVDLTKPASSLGITLAVPFAAVIYASLSGLDQLAFLRQNFLDIVYASVTLFLIHGGSQALNHAEDAEMDKQTDHKDTRPIPAGVLTEEDSRAIAWMFIMAGVARAFTTTLQFGVFASVLALFGVFYNLEPIRAKKILWVNIIWQATSRGLLLYPAAFSIWDAGLNPFAWAMGSVSFLLVLSMQQTADFSDVEIDERFGIITPAVHYGLRDLVKIMAAIAGAMFLLYTAFIALDIIPNMYSVYLLMVPIGYSLISLWRDPKAVYAISGNNFSWYIFYFSLASMYILPAIELVW